MKKELETRSRDSQWYDAVEPVGRAIGEATKTDNGAIATIAAVGVAGVIGITGFAMSLIGGNKK